MLAAPMQACNQQIPTRLQMAFDSRGGIQHETQSRCSANAFRMSMYLTKTAPSTGFISKTCAALIKQNMFAWSSLTTATEPLQAMSQPHDIQELLDYWYSPRISKHWFASTPALDEEIRMRYEALWQQAAAGELDDWAFTPEGALALAIVLDQLPLNMYRGTPAAFATEQKAVGIARQAVAHGHDQSLPSDRRVFLYMPLMHSENLEDQDQSVALFQQSGLAANLRFAEHHRSIVRRFGRFPHRNAILNRESSPEEIAYLASAEAFKG
jgi:uncharacterized protein (DUF924 family)